MENTMKCEGCANGNCEMIKQLIDLLVKQNEEHRANILKYEEMLANVQTQCISQADRAAELVEKVFQIMGKVNEYVSRIESLYEEIKRDEDKAKERLEKANEELMKQNTMLTKLVSLLYTPNNSNGTQVHVH